MRLDHDTPIAAVQELANMTRAVPSDMDYPWDAASRLKRFLIEDGHVDSDLIPETRLETLARQALRYQEPEWEGRDSAEATPQHERFTP